MNSAFSFKLHIITKHSRRFLAQVYKSLLQFHMLHMFNIELLIVYANSAVFSGGAGGARAPPEFGGSQKGRSLISAYRSLAITTNTPGFKKLSTTLRVF